jgi:hypothetical protein
MEFVELVKRVVRGLLVDGIVVPYRVFVFLQKVSVPGLIVQHFDVDWLAEKRPILAA